MAKPNSVAIDVGKIEKHLRRIMDGSHYVAACSLIQGKVYVNDHILKHPNYDGLTIEKKGNDKNEVKLKDLEFVSFSVDVSSADIGKLNFDSGKKLPFSTPTINLPVTLYTFGKDGRLKAIRGNIVDVDKKGTFGFNGSTEMGNCGGLYISDATGSVVGRHYLGQTGNIPNRGSYPKMGN